MSKGDETREMILHRAAAVFNQKGYSGSSIADIMEATGLEKGGIYNHFQNKDDLALQAFDYAVDLVRQQYAEAIRGKFHAVDRLKAVVNIFRAMEEGHPLPGGCPVHNTAIEADDTHPLLRQRAQEAMDEFHAFIRRIIERGIQRGEVKPDVNPEEVASLMYATMEGALMMTQLSGDLTHMDRVIQHLNWYVESALRA